MGHHDRPDAMYRLKRRTKVTVNLVSVLSWEEGDHDLTLTDQERLLVFPHLVGVNGIESVVFPRLSRQRAQRELGVVCASAIE